MSGIIKPDRMAVALKLLNAAQNGVAPTLSRGPGEMRIGVRQQHIPRLLRAVTDGENHKCDVGVRKSLLRKRKR